MIIMSKDMWPAAISKWNYLVNKMAYIKWVSIMLERCRDVIKNKGFSIK